jgi:hypothetical protein
MPSQATYDDANLILRLYELRRDEKLREARAWFASGFVAPENAADLLKMLPPGSQENTYFRMVIGYWEQACSFVTAGVLNQELFFQSSGELLVVWEKVRGIVPAWREFTKNPDSFHNMQTVGDAYIKWFESKGPETYPAFQGMVKMLSAAAASKGQAG